MNYYRLTNIERKGRYIYLVCRDQNKTRVIFEIKDFYPYGFIKRNVSIPLRFRNIVTSRIAGKWHLLDGTPMDKIIFTVPDVVRDFRQAMPEDSTAEMDVIYTTRFLVDIRMRSGYFKLKLKHQQDIPFKLKEATISYKDIVPLNIEDVPEPIPIRESQLDIESVNGKPVLIGQHDSYTNNMFFYGWANAKTLSETNLSYSDSFKGLVSNNNKTKNNLSLKRNVVVYPKLKTCLDMWTKHMERYQYDVLAGWWLKDYDIPELFKACDNTGVKINTISPFNSAPAPEKIKGLVVYDDIEGYTKIVSKQLKSLKLHKVIEDEYKVQIAHNPLNIPNLWKNNYSGLIDYNSSHVDACRYLSQQKGIVEFIYSLVYTCCCRFDDSDSAMHLIDALLLSTKDEWVVYPNKPQYGESEEVAGATVFEPKPELVTDYEAIIDAKRLYPSIMVSMNIGKDTKVASIKLKNYKELTKWASTKDTLPINEDYDEQIVKINQHIKHYTNKLNDEIHLTKKKYKNDICIPLKNEDGIVERLVFFTKKFKSVVSKAFSFLFNLRDSLEDILKEYVNKGVEKFKAIIDLLKQKIFAVKILTNSIYGLVGNAGFRLYEKECQEAVTQVGRDVIQFISKTSSEVI